MSDLAEMERRLRAALERIGAGVDRLAGQPPVENAAFAAADPAEIADLQAQLEAERAARAELEADLMALRSPPSESGAEVERLLAQVDAQAADNQRLRASVAALREEVRRLSEAMAGGLSDASLLNQAMQAELEALRAQRASETTEMADILAELDRIVQAEEAAHA